jgi:hypothetical protein
MGSNNIIVREYLESLREADELDYLFPILLVLMGYKIKSTPVHSKGQSQYGKDVVAVGFKDGVKKRFYFEIKGHADKDIDDRTFNKKDGIRDSILASKDTPFEDKADPAFNKLPIEIVTVHNGIIKENFRPQFNGFISTNFPEGNFQDWDIYYLTELFGKYLFSEYLLTDEESLRLFKRTLVLLDAPENDFSDFKQLVNLQIDRVTEIKGRAFKKLFATLNLLAGLILHYSKENNNLYPARECLTYLVIRTWAWILKNKTEDKTPVLNEYRKLINIHFNMLIEYFQKTLPTAITKNGLYSENGAFYESIGYSVGSFDYLNYLIYFMQARKYWPGFINQPSAIKNVNIRGYQKGLLKKIITNNDGSCRPLLDNHSIAIVNVLLFFLNDPDFTEQDKKFIESYLIKLLDNIILVKKTRNRFPLLSNDLTILAEAAATNTRPANYEDRTSLLIAYIFEFSALLGAEYAYSFKEHFKSKIDLQTAHPYYSEFDIEQLLFEKHLDEEYYVEHVDMTDKLEEFQKKFQKNSFPKIKYRTDAAGFPFLRTLAHIYYENELFVEEWRYLFRSLYPKLKIENVV